RLMAAAMMTRLLLKEELERERAVVIGEYDRNESSPFFQLNTAMGKALWGDAWSRKNPLGERDVILSTTPEKMRAIQQRYYVPNNTAIIVTGDIAPSKAFALAKSTFGDWKRAEHPLAADPIPRIPPVKIDAWLIVEQPIGTVLLMLQWQGPGAGADPEATYAADVFSDVLNQPGSRFQRRLVDSGLFHSIAVNYY